MLTPEEEKFLDYWEKNREKEKNVFRQLRYGLPAGLIIGILIIVNFSSGWYERANMVAFSQSTPIALLIALIGIIVFWSVFSKKHRWDMNEQRYKELQYKKRKSSENLMQQDDTNISQSGNEI